MSSSNLKLPMPFKSSFKSAFQRKLHKQKQRKISKRQFFSLDRSTETETETKKIHSNYIKLRTQTNTYTLLVKLINGISARTRPLQLLCEWGK